MDGPLSYYATLVKKIKLIEGECNAPLHDIMPNLYTSPLFKKINLYIMQFLICLADSEKGLH